MNVRMAVRYGDNTSLFLSISVNMADIRKTFKYNFADIPQKCDAGFHYLKPSPFKSQAF
jgi:hypothetical protein